MKREVIEGKVSLGLSALAALAFALTATVGVGLGTARADEATDAYEKYYEAIEAKTQCEDSGRPDAKTMEKISVFITSQNNFALTAGQSLMAIEDARARASKLVKERGCDDSVVTKLITLYHTTEAAAQ